MAYSFKYFHDSEFFRKDECSGDRDISNQATALIQKGAESVFILCQTRMNDHTLEHMDSPCPKWHAPLWKCL